MSSTQPPPWTDDVVECITNCLCAHDTRAAVAFLTCCSTHRAMLPQFGISFLHLHRFGSAGIRLPVQQQLAAHSALPTVTSTAVRHRCLGRAHFPPACKLYIRDDTLFTASIAAHLIVSWLVGDRSPHDSTLLAKLHGTESTEWRAGNALRSVFVTGNALYIMKAIVFSRRRQRQRLDNVVIATNLTEYGLSGRVARFEWCISFSCRHRRKTPSGPRDNNEFEDYVELSEFSLSHTSLLVTSRPPLAWTPPL